MSRERRSRSCAFYARAVANVRAAGGRAPAAGSRRRAPKSLRRNELCDHLATVVLAASRASAIVQRCRPAPAGQAGRGHRLDPRRGPRRGRRRRRLGRIRSFHSVEAGHVLVVRQFGEIVGQRGDGFQTIAPWQTRRGACRPRSRASASRWTTAARRRRGRDHERPRDQRGDAAASTRSSTLNYRRQRRWRSQELFTDVGSTFFDEGRRAARLPGLQERDGQVQERRRRAEPGADPRRRSGGARPPAAPGCSINVVDFLHRRPRLPRGVHAAIERKQVATQDELAALQKAQQSKAEAQQEIERARGQAQAQRLRATLAHRPQPPVEALQILEAAPPQIVYLPAGQGNLLDPSTFLKSAEPADP